MAKLGTTRRIDAELPGLLSLGWEPVKGHRQHASDIEPEDLSRSCAFGAPVPSWGQERSTAEKIKEGGVRLRRPPVITAGDSERGTKIVNVRKQPWFVEAHRW